MRKCGCCHIIKDSQEFYKNSSKPDGLSSYCKKCNTLYVRKRYLKDKDYYDDKNKQVRIRNQKYLYEYLSSHPCIDCGESDPVVLEFDHMGDKKFDVSYMVSAQSSIATLSKEIQKCVVRCANCHRKKTAKQRSYFKYLIQTADKDQG